MSLQRQIAPSYLTGGGGVHFEEYIQSAFTLLMLVQGYPPQFPNHSVKRLDFQAKPKGYETDDIVIHLERIGSKETKKILTQVKHGISLTEGSREFHEVVNAAWIDFNNSKVFRRGYDVFALITGPINRTDTEVRTLLNMARHRVSHEEFFNEVEIANYCSNTQRTKLNVFRTHLKTANGEIEVSDEETFSFLKSFHLLGYDLDFSPSVTLSLLHSMICQYQPQEAHSLWTDIVDYVREINQAGGSITLDSIPDWIKEKFIRRDKTTMPKIFLHENESALDYDSETLSDIGVAFLLGCWNEGYEKDTKQIESVSGKKYSDWIKSVRKVHQSSNNIISLNNGVWRVIGQVQSWSLISKVIYDHILDGFKGCAIEVLSAKDPALELSPDKRFAAIVYGKAMEYSDGLRRGIAETLALLGTKKVVLENCSDSKIENVVAGVLRNVFDDGCTWTFWASINNLLPMLSETNPRLFLELLNDTLLKSPEIVTTLYGQGGAGFIWERNYLVGLIWALESLAWDEEYLVSACVALGFLAQFQNGNAGNSPLDTLKEILLPWHPQTLASVQKRKVAVITLVKEYPDTAWELILRLLPSAHQVASGTNTPKWFLDVSDKEDKQVSRDEYQAQIDNYSKIAVTMAIADVQKLIVLIQHLHYLTDNTYTLIVEHLDSQVIYEEEKNMLDLWKALENYIFQQKTYSKAKWTEKNISVLEGIAEKYKPKNLFYLYNPLFGAGRVYRYEESDTEEKRKIFSEKQNQAISEIFDTGGYDLVAEFVETVELPRTVGYALGSIAEQNFDEYLFCEDISLESPRKKDFIGGYIWKKYQRIGTSWVTSLNVSSWSKAQKVSFLINLPFVFDVWVLVNDWLGEEQADYWEIVNGNPYQEKEKLQVAIEKLLLYNRPLLALECIDEMYRINQPVASALSVAALKKLQSSTEQPYTMTRHHIIEVIKRLQNADDIDIEDMTQIEWAYLQLLDREEKAAPKILEKKLASEPSFFCEIIRLSYKPRDRREEINQYDESTRKRLAENAYHLLHGWKHIPGMKPNGEIDIDYLRDWVFKVVTSCTESGHLEVALTHIGHVLIYSPPDPKGLWIDKDVAELLNSKDFQDMRNGFETNLYNSRGIHNVVPSGQPEKELAKKYRKQAEDVENIGCFRLAETMRKLAKSYDRDAERIIKEHSQEQE